MKVLALKDKSLNDMNYTNVTTQLEGMFVTYLYVWLTKCGMCFACVYIDSSLQIGYVTHRKVKQLVEEGSITETTSRKFYSAVRHFFKKAVEYSLEHPLLDDELLKSVSFVNFEKRLESNPI